MSFSGLLDHKTSSVDKTNSKVICPKPDRGGMLWKPRTCGHEGTWLWPCQDIFKTRNHHWSMLFLGPKGHIAILEYYGLLQCSISHQILWNKDVTKCPNDRSELWSSARAVCTFNPRVIALSSRLFSSEHQASERGWERPVMVNKRTFCLPR